jgi:hypothetical protein
VALHQLQTEQLQGIEKYIHRFSIRNWTKHTSYLPLFNRQSVAVPRTMPNFQSVHVENSFKEGRQAKKIVNTFVPFYDNVKSHERYVRSGPNQEVFVNAQDSRLVSHVASIHYDSENEDINDSNAQRGIANFDYTQKSMIPGSDSLPDAQAYNTVWASTSTSANLFATDEHLPDVNEVAAIGLGIYEEDSELSENSVSSQSPLSPHMHWKEPRLIEPQVVPTSSISPNHYQAYSPTHNHTSFADLRNVSNTTVWPDPSPTTSKLRLTTKTMSQSLSKRTLDQQNGDSTSKAGKHNLRALFARGIESHKRTADRPDAGDTILQIINNVRGVTAEAEERRRNKKNSSKQQVHSHQRPKAKPVSLPQQSFPKISATTLAQPTPVVNSTRSTKPRSKKAFKPPISKNTEESTSTKPANQSKSSHKQNVASPKLDIRLATAPAKAESFVPTPDSISPYRTGPPSRPYSSYPMDEVSPAEEESVRASTSLENMEVLFGASRSVQYDAKRTYIDMSKPSPPPPQLSKVPKRSKNRKKQLAFNKPDRPLTPYPSEKPEPLCFSDVQLSASINRSKQRKHNPRTTSVTPAPLPLSEGQGPGKVSAHLVMSKLNKLRFATIEDTQTMKPNLNSLKEKREGLGGFVHKLSEFQKCSIASHGSGANKSHIKFQGQKISVPGPLITTHVGTANIAASSGGVDGPGSAFSTKLDRRGRPIHPHMRAQGPDHHEATIAVNPRPTSSSHIPKFPSEMPYTTRSRHGGRICNQRKRRQEGRHAEPSIQNLDKEPLSTKLPSKYFLKDGKRGRSRKGSEASFGCIGLQTMPESRIPNRINCVDLDSTTQDTPPPLHEDITGHTVHTSLNAIESTNSRYGIPRSHEQRALSHIKKRTQERKRMPSPGPIHSHHSSTDEADSYPRSLEINTPSAPQQPSNSEENAKDNVERGSQYRDTRFYQLYEDVLREYQG